MNNSKMLKWIGVFFLVLLVNTAYVWAFAFPTVFYMTNVLVHLGLGVVLFFAGMLSNTSWRTLLEMHWDEPITELRIWPSERK